MNRILCGISNRLFFFLIFHCKSTEIFFFSLLSLEVWDVLVIRGQKKSR